MDSPTPKSVTVLKNVQSYFFYRDYKMSLVNCTCITLFALNLFLSLQIKFPKMTYQNKIEQEKQNKYKDTHTGQKSIL